MDQDLTTYPDLAWQCLAEQSLTGVALLEGTRFTRANPRFAEMFGYRDDEILDIPAAETIAHSCRLRVFEHIHSCLVGAPHQPVLVYEGLKKDGSSLYLELSVSRQEMAGGVFAVFMVSDITAKRRAEGEVLALNRSLAGLATKDPLTSLYSKGYTEASLERELIRCERDTVPLSVVMCDIDDFQAVNDVLGRSEGDEVLKAFGSLLTRRCRRSDLACRYDGDEFLMVFPGMPAHVASRWAERIRVAVASARATHGSRSLQVNASFGVAAFPEHGESWQELIAAADAAQVAAKATGGNQVLSAPPKTLELKGPDLALLLAREM